MWDTLVATETALFWDSPVPRSLASRSPTRYALKWAYELSCSRELLRLSGPSGRRPSLLCVHIRGHPGLRRIRRELLVGRVRGRTSGLGKPERVRRGQEKVRNT